MKITLAILGLLLGLSASAHAKDVELKKNSKRELGRKPASEQERAMTEAEEAEAMRRANCSEATTNSECKENGCYWYYGPHGKKSDYGECYPDAQKSIYGEPEY